jgi:hypothetical protein
MSKATTSNATKKGAKIDVKSLYNPNGKGFTETLTTAVRQIVLAGAFETFAQSDGTKDSRQLNIR